MLPDFTINNPEEFVKTLNISEWIQKAKLSEWQEIENNLTKFYENFRKTLRITQDIDGEKLRQNIGHILSQTDKSTKQNLLHFGLKDNKTKIVEILIDFNVNVNAADKDGLKPIHYAAIYGKEDVVRMLIQKNADATAKGGDLERLALHYACCRSIGAQSLVKLLLKISGPNCRLTPDAEDSIPLYLATDNNNLVVCRELLNAQTKLQLRYAKRDTGDTVLHLACRKKDINLAKLFLEAGAPIDMQNNEGHTPLHIAAWEREAQIVEILYEFRANPNIMDKFDRTPLHIATERGNTEIVDILIDKFHSSLNARTDDGSTLVHIAALSGQPETAKLFIKKGVPLLMPNKYGAIALHSAARRGQTEMVKLLLQNSVNVDALTKDRFSALHIAVMYNKPSVILVLLGYGAQVDLKGGKNMETALHMVSRLPDEERCAELLIKSGANVDATQLNNETALHIAAKFGNIKIINLLLQEQVDVYAINKDKETALHFAVMACHADIVKLILQTVFHRDGKGNAIKYVNYPNLEGETVIHKAAQLTNTVSHHLNEETDIVESLLAYGADVNKTTIKLRETPLHYCAKAGNSEALAIMLRSIPPEKISAIVNLQDKAGWSPLLVASEYGSLKAVQLLLKYQARVDVFDEQGKAALHLACENGHEDIVDILVANKAYVNVKSKLGITPLHLAALNGYDALSKKLIEQYGANVSTGSLNKKTPLHLAAQTGQVEVCKTLLTYSADPFTFDSNGYAPIHLAAENNHCEVIEIFLSQYPDMATILTMNGNTCAHIAAIKGNLDVIRTLMKYNPDSVMQINQELMSTPLQLAAQGGHVNIVRILLEAGAVPTQEDKNGYNALQLAAQSGQTSVLKAILAFSPAMSSVVSSKSGLNPLHVAARSGKVEFVREMLEKIPATIKSELTTDIANHNRTSRDKIDYGLTPLHFAAQYGHESIVRLLLNSPGVEVNSPSQLMGYIPLHYAALGGHTSVASILISKSALQLQTKDKRGRTPLHIAAYNGQTDMVSLLLSQGAQVDSRDNNSWTPLHFASKAGYLEIVKKLIQASASPLAQTSSGDIPLTLAQANNHISVFSFLVKKEHPIFELLMEQNFIFDMMVCGRFYNNRNIVEYVLNSPAPIEVAVVLAKRFNDTAARNKERARELNLTGTYCEAMAYELTSLAVELAPGGARSLLRASDHTGQRQLINLILQNELKTLTSHPSIQIWLSQLWVDTLADWPWYYFVLLFIGMLIFPPLWISLSLPCCYRFNRNPIIKFICYLGSHVIFCLLLLSVTAFQIYQAWQSTSLIPHWNEWLLLIWILGNFVQELFSRNQIVGLGWLKILILLVCGVAIFVHFMGIFFQGRARLIVLYTRNQLFAIALVMAFIQFLEFLSFDDLFGPWAVVIRELITDMSRFLIVLALFLVGFSFAFTTIYVPMMPLKTRTNAVGEEIYKTNFLNPIQSFELLFFSLFGLVSPDMFPVQNQTPAYSFVWSKLVFGIFLMVTFIVLLNLLIAMLSYTYETIQEESDLEWKYGRGQLIINTEKQPPAPSPINLFTKSWVFFKLLFRYGFGIFSLSKEAFLNEEEKLQCFPSGKLQPVGGDSSVFSSGFIQREKFSSPNGSQRKGLSTNRPISDVVDWKLVGEKYLEIQGLEIDRTENLNKNRGSEHEMLTNSKRTALAETTDMLQKFLDTEKPRTLQTG